MRSLNRRRSVALFVGVGSLVAAVLVVGQVAGWTTVNTAFAAKPARATDLAAQLDAQRDHAKAVESQLRDVTTRADELSAALDATAAAASRDAAAADRLSPQLAAARERLATLEAQLAAARRQPPVVTVAAAATAASGDDDPHDGGDGEHHEDDD